jgi:hypothetical protein
MCEAGAQGDTRDLENGLFVESDLFKTLYLLYILMWN